MDFSTSPSDSDVFQITEWAIRRNIPFAEIDNPLTPNVMKFKPV